MATAPKGIAANSRFVRRMIDSHSVLGLAFAALIYVVSLTGAVALFEHEIALWENPSAPATTSASPQLLDTALQKMLSQTGGPEMEAVFPRVNAPYVFQPLLMGGYSQKATPDSKFEFKQYVLDPETGEIAQPYERELQHFLVELHTDLHLPRPWGRYLVGLLGVCMITLIISGILAHPTILKDAFKLRLKSNTRMAWTDMHNRLSVWGLPFHLVITFTGAFLGVAGLAILAIAYVAYDGDTERAVEIIQGAAPIEGQLLEKPIPIAAMIERIEGDGGKVSGVFVDQPFSTGGVTRFNVRDDSALSQNYAAHFRNTGTFEQYLGGKDASAGMTAVGLIAPLHFGTFGGYGIKGLYFVLSLALTYITSTGMMIWFRRRTQQGSPVPKSQAAWHGMTTGLSFGMALATLVAAMQLSLSMSWIGLGSWAAVFAIVWLSPGGMKLVKVLYGIIGAMLCLAAALHLPHAASASPALMGHLLSVDLMLILFGAGHLWVAGMRDWIGAMLAPSAKEVSATS